METKQCTKCKEIKSLNEFYKDKYKKDGHTCGCIYCEKLTKLISYQKHKDKRQKYYLDNRDKRIQQVKIWSENNKDKVKNNGKRWREQNYFKYREKINNWRINNPDRIKEYGKRYRSKYESRDKLNNNIARKINCSLRGNKKGHHWEALVGYSLDQLMCHLESLFTDGMSWNNYGKNGWSIDHIIPISLWSFSSYEDREFKQCWTLCNLQPLWFKDNCSKNNRV